MFDFDWLREILSTIGKNKLRTILTSFAVAWGIFMLIVLLAAGNGLENGLRSNFANRALNMVSVSPGWTSTPYKGLPTNRKIKLDERDLDLLRSITEIEYITARINRNVTLSYKQEYGTWFMQGVSPDVAQINYLTVDAGNGRLLNELDISKKRKVIIISPDVKNVLFKGKDPLGEIIMANNIAFQVIGVYDAMDGHTDPPVFIPFTTAKTLYGGDATGFGQIDFTVRKLYTIDSNRDFVERLRAQFGVLHGFNVDDRSALYVRNTAEESVKINQMFSTITIFIIGIGIASLMAGIVGVGNIMLITVKERTREIGIRKALGAKPLSILKLIIMESILITTVAGYLGIVLGIALVELLSDWLSGLEDGGMSVFKDPSVDLGAIIYATIFLIICGVVAGMMPAIKATRISPIEAMREE